MKESIDERVSQQREYILQLKEMYHYSKSNIEHLATMSLTLDELKCPSALAEQLNQVLNLQNEWHEAADLLVENWERECNRIENEQK